jgi:hypothetical protein
LPKNVGNGLLLTGPALIYLVWSSGFNVTHLPVYGFVINGSKGRNSRTNEREPTQIKPSDRKRILKEFVVF